MAPPFSSSLPGDLGAQAGPLEWPQVDIAACLRADRLSRSLLVTQGQWPKAPAQEY